MNAFLIFLAVGPLSCWPQSAGAARPAAEKSGAGLQETARPPVSLLAQFEAERRAVAEDLRRAFVSVSVQSDDLPMPVLFSGTLLDGQGHFAAPSKFLRGARVITVTTADQRSYLARELIAVAETPLSVLKLVGERFPATPKLGCASTLEVGDFITVVSNSLGLDGTTVFGSVSGLRRRVAQFPEMELLQTTVTAIEGTIGGVVGNSRGEVVAVLVGGPELDTTTADVTLSTRTRATPAERADAPSSRPAAEQKELVTTLRAVRAPQWTNASGVSLAVPVTHLLGALAQVPESPRETLAAADARGKPLLGVILNESIDDLTRKQLKLPQAGALVIDRVFEASLAQRAGLEPLDILLKVNRVAVESNDHFRQLFRESFATGALELELLRAGSVRRVSIDVPAARTPDKK